MKYYKSMILFILLLSVILGLSMVSATDGNVSGDFPVIGTSHVPDESGSMPAVNKTAGNNVDKKSISRENIVDRDSSIDTGSSDGNRVISVDSVADTCYGDDVCISGNASYLNGTGIGNTDISIMVNSDEYSTVTDSVGSYSFKFTASGIGVNNVTVKFPDSDSGSQSLSFNVRALNSSIVAGNLTGHLGSNVLLNASLFDEHSNPVSNGSVLVKINGKTLGFTDVSMGHVGYNLYLDPVRYGKQGYNVSFIYGGTGTVSSSRYDTVLSVIPFNPIVNIPVSRYYIDDTAVLKVNIGNGMGYDALSGNVQFKLNNLTYKVNGTPLRVQVSGGTAVLRFYTSRKFVGSNNITILYSGNGKFDSVKTTLNNVFVVENAKRTVMSAGPVTAGFGQKAVLRAKLSGVKGNVLTKGQVAVKINGKTVGHANITNGIVSYTTYINPAMYSAKNYTVTFKFGGEGKFIPAAVNTILSINKITPHITYNTVITDNITILKVNIGNGNIKADNGSIGLKINDKTYQLNGKAVTGSVSNGTVVFKLAVNRLLLNSNLTIKYTGNRIFNGAKPVFNYYSNAVKTRTVNNTCIITLAMDVSLSGNKVLTGKATNIILNGCNHKINANNHQLLSIPEKYHVNIKNLYISNSNAVNGGAIHNKGQLTIINTTFISNRATRGGVIYNTGNITLINNTFIDNMATKCGGVIYNTEKTMIDHDTFISNNAKEAGGVIYNNKTATIKNSVFYDNNAYDGGVIYTNKNMYIQNSKYDANSAEYAGGIILQADGQVTITNTVATNNRAQNGGITAIIKGKTIINRTQLNNNIAEFGGTIYLNPYPKSSDYYNININNTDMNNNIATTGSAVINAIILNQTMPSKITINNTRINNNQITYNKEYQIEENIITAIDIPLTITNTNITGNQAKNDIIYMMDTLKITNTYIQNNKAETIIETYNQTNIDRTTFTGNTITTAIIKNAQEQTKTKTSITNSNIYKNNKNIIQANLGYFYTNITRIENNYWGSTNPNWDTTLLGVNKPQKYSKTRIITPSIQKTQQITQTNIGNRHKIKTGNKKTISVIIKNRITSDTTLIIRIRDIENNKNLDTGTITVTNNNKTVNTKLVNKIAKIKLTPNNGIQKITIKYHQNNTIQKTITLNITKSDTETNITVQRNRASNQTAKIQITVKDENNQPVTKGTVKLLGDGKSIKTLNITNGKAETTIKISREAIITANYTENNLYKHSITYKLAEPKLDTPTKIANYYELTYRKISTGIQYTDTKYKTTIKINTNYTTNIDRIKEAIQAYYEAPAKLKQSTPQITFTKQKNATIQNNKVRAGETTLNNKHIEIYQESYPLTSITLYHEMGHTIDTINQKYSESNAFKKAIENDYKYQVQHGYTKQLASQYAQTSYNKKHSYQENWAETISMVAHSKIENNGLALIEVSDGNLLDYDEWKERHPYTYKYAYSIIY